MVQLLSQNQVAARLPECCRVVATGNLFEVFVNGQKLYEVGDDTFTDAGKVGLWTKADSVTYFDDLRIVAK